MRPLIFLQILNKFVAIKGRAIDSPHDSQESHGVVAFGLFLGGGHDIATVFRDWIITGDKLSPV